jgi:hypothetical protein
MTAGSRSSSRNASELVSIKGARFAFRRWTALSLGCAAFLVSPLASGDENEKNTCIAKHEEAQVAKRQGRLRDARAALLTCLRPVCPEMVRIDCSDWPARGDRAAISSCAYQPSEPAGSSNGGAPAGAACGLRARRGSSSPAVAMWENIFVASAGPAYFEAFFKGQKNPATAVQRPSRQDEAVDKCGQRHSP